MDRTACAVPLFARGTSVFRFGPSLHNARGGESSGTGQAVRCVGKEPSLSCLVDRTACAVPLFARGTSDFRFGPSLHNASGGESSGTAQAVRFVAEELTLSCLVDRTACAVPLFARGTSDFRFGPSLHNASGGESSGTAQAVRCVGEDSPSRSATSPMSNPAKIGGDIEIPDSDLEG